MYKEKIIINSDPIPNWPNPNELKKKYFPRYCWPVIQAIIYGLNRDKKFDLCYKFINDRDNITNEELQEIIESYKVTVDIILMKAWL